MPPIDVRAAPTRPERRATYAEAAAGEVCALFGSTDHLEIAVNGGSAAPSSAGPRRAVQSPGQRLTAMRRCTTRWPGARPRRDDLRLHS